MGSEDDFSAQRATNSYPAGRVSDYSCRMNEYRLPALIIEDDPLWSATLAEQLADWGFDAHVATTVSAARTSLPVRDWTLVVLDLSLPDGSGVMIAEALSTRRPRPVIIAVTGTATVEEAFKLSQLGVRGYLAKPVNARDLRETIRTLLAEASQNSTELESLAGAQVGNRSYQEVTAQVRRAMVQQALRLAGGNKTGAARILQVSRQAIQQLIRSLDVHEYPYQ